MGRNRNKFKNKDATKETLGVKLPESAIDARKKQEQLEAKMRSMYDNLDSLSSAVNVAKNEGKLKEEGYQFKKKKKHGDKPKRRDTNFSVKNNKITEKVPDKESKTQKKKVKKTAQKAAKEEKKQKKAKKALEKSKRKERAKNPSPDPQRFEQFQRQDQSTDDDDEIEEIQATPATRINGTILEKGRDYSIVEDYEYNLGPDADDDDLSDQEEDDYGEDIYIEGEDSGDELVGIEEVEDEDDFEEYDGEDGSEASMDFDDDSVEALYNGILADGKDISLYSNMEDMASESGEDEESGSELDSLADEDEDAALVVKTGSGKSDKAPIDFTTFPFSKSNHSVHNANSAFQWILGPCEIQAFFKSIFEKKVLNVKRKNKKYYGNLFSTAALTDLLEKHTLEYGTNINIASYKNGVRTTLNGEGRVYPQTVKSHLLNKCSVQFVNPPTFDDNVWYICEILQEIFGSFVGANTYLTPANSAGFAPHWDEIDAFILQLEGSKRWKVYAPEGKDDSLPRESSGNFTDEEMKHRKPLFDDVVHEGDLLYVPRGFIHQALTTKEHSLHITISVCRRNAFADMMEKLIPEVLEQMAERSATLRKSLPCNYLDMGGIADNDYPSDESYSEKLLMPFNMHIRNLAKLSRNFMDNGVDMMAREFMKTALPPKLTPEEKKLSVMGKRVSLLSQKPDFKWTRETKIRFIRKHAQRLIFESANKAFIAHRMNNSRLYEGKPEQILDISPEMITGFTNLVSAYPEYIKVGDLECEAHGFDVALAKLLYENCLIMVKA